MKSTAQCLTKKLHELGYTLAVQHYRYDKTVKYPLLMRCITRDTSKFTSRGGYTAADIWDTNNNIISSGKAICSPKDNFQKKLGWVKAVGRAIGNLA